MKSRIDSVALVAITILFLLSSCAPAASSAGAAPRYLSPAKGSEYVSKGATIAVRYGPTLSQNDLSGIAFDVKGAESGEHSGEVILATDGKTVIFKPNQPFTEGERVDVDVTAQDLEARGIGESFSYSFTVGSGQGSGSPGSDEEIEQIDPPAGATFAFPEYLTLPDDIPPYEVTVSEPEAGDGYIFVAPYRWGKPEYSSYILIIDNQGEIVYYQPAAEDRAAYDFKRQPNGALTYFSAEDEVFYVMDQRYQVIDAIEAGNGYVADLHELVLLPNGHALLMVYDGQTVDMSKHVENGNKSAFVTGLILQELDPEKNVIFQWSSWDHMPFSDGTVDMTEEKVDYVHGNAIDIDQDGNWLLSSRNLSEITKINRATGEIMWRMGGKSNQFEFANDPERFGHQHDIRVLPNGNITIFDNRAKAGASRAIEYEVDEEDKTAALVWEYERNPPVWAAFMGNAQRLPNGNTLMDWGSLTTEEGYEYINITEVTPGGDVVFELAFERPYVSYRAFRFPWMGFPTTQPALAFKQDGGNLLLGYSWNGATQVASYRLLGGSSPNALQQVDEKEKTGFETQTLLEDPPEDQCYFQVIPVDENGVELTRSAVISTDPDLCPVAE